MQLAFAGLAHDIRTPLTGIVALSELLQAADLPEREQRWAEAIKSAADHLARLTTLVVDAAKMDAARIVLRAEPFAPRALADAVASSLAARAQAKSLEVNLDIASDLPEWANGDAVRLRSALENLIDNAVKFTERGSVAFSASASRGPRSRIRLTFTITDTGIGIVARDLKKLFKPFSQANDDVARRYGGAGLGLVLVKRIARAMGGDLTVTSTPGRGSSFRLTVMADKANPASRPRASKGQTAAQSLRLLSVEDNPFGRVVLNTVLSELGHGVSFVGSGEAAVEAVARGGYDAVIMDVALADIDGIETTRRIRALPPPAGAIPIIGVSGRAEPRDAEAAKAAGMDHYLRKPASPAELNEIFSSIAAKRAIRRAGSA